MEQIKEAAYLSAPKSGLYKFDSDNSLSENMIYFGIKAVNFLKNRQKRIKIAMLGAEITSDPHYFDRGTPAWNLLIDMLCNSECEIYYSGDIDPEGIEIADKLLKRGNGKIIPWCFSLEDYKNSISNKIISEQSLKKLEKVESDFFKELILKVKEEKKAGYQELILNKMIEDIKNNF